MVAAPSGLRGATFLRGQLARLAANAVHLGLDAENVSKAIRWIHAYRALLPPADVREAVLSLEFGRTVEHEHVLTSKVRADAQVQDCLRDLVANWPEGERDGVILLTGNAIGCPKSQDLFKQMGEEDYRRVPRLMDHMFKFSGAKTFVVDEAHQIQAHVGELADRVKATKANDPQLGKFTAAFKRARVALDDFCTIDKAVPDVQTAADAAGMLMAIFEGRFSRQLRDVLIGRISDRIMTFTIREAELGAVLISVVWHSIDADLRPPRSSWRLPDQPESVAVCVDWGLKAFYEIDFSTSSHKATFLKHVVNVAWKLPQEEAIEIVPRLELAVRQLPKEFHHQL